MTPVDPKGKNARPDARMKSARNMPDAANSENSLKGYAAVNGLDEQSEIARRAHELYLQREQNGQRGTAEDDWFRAEQEVRQDRMKRNVA